ncbi:MAG: hypothetical protein L7S64_09655, partial [Longimicrobiales bacterium]|nr:hypothetical protein [Longimicrobiales bacterium]
MNGIRLLNGRTLLLGALTCLSVLMPRAVAAQADQLRLVAEPAAIEVIVGRSVPLTVQVFDSSGQAVDIAVRFAAPRSALRVRDGNVQGLEAGTYEIVATAALGPDVSAAVEPLTIPVTVAWPPVATR